MRKEFARTVQDLAAESLLASNIRKEKLQQIDDLLLGRKPEEENVFGIDWAGLRGSNKADMAVGNKHGVINGCHEVIYIIVDDLGNIYETNNP